MSKKPITCGDCANFTDFERTPTGRMKRDTIGVCVIAAEAAKEVNQYLRETPPSVGVSGCSFPRRIGCKYPATACRKFKSRNKAEA
jgi:hypothetical protein